MPPTNSTFRGPWPRVLTRIGRPCTDVPTTSQPGESVGGACVVGVVEMTGGGSLDDSELSGLGVADEVVCGRADSRWVSLGRSDAPWNLLSMMEPATRMRLAMRPTITIA